LGALAAESVFRLFHYAWVKIPNTFAYFSFFLDQLCLVIMVAFSGFSRRQLRALKKIYFLSALFHISMEIKCAVREKKATHG
ncbi:hypothetical protein, partial [Brevibacillus panacihumi]